MARKEFEIFHYYDRYIKQVRLHHHDFYELYYFVSGSVEYTVEGKTYSLESGDLMLISPNELHQLIVPDNAPYERFVLWIDPKFLERNSTANTDLKQVFASVVGDNRIRPRRFDCNILYDKLEKIAASADSLAFGSDLWCRNEIIGLLLIAASLKQGQVSGQHHENGVVAAALQYVDMHLEENLCIEDIARSCFVSPSRLSHLFKQVIGTSLYQYIVKKRLIRAKELLRSGLSAFDTYSQCGFGDYANFLRAFKKEYGLTPKQYILQNSAGSISSFPLT
ncbi:MAG: AraC family transcriptional regulator [Clostridia bacterium]|nr:AraC family transcriptional regulator [Clostridia bacterium]